jgi:hypothetical protein
VEQEAAQAAVKVAAQAAAKAAALVMDHLLLVEWGDLL